MTFVGYEVCRIMMFVAYDVLSVLLKGLSQCRKTYSFRENVRKKMKNLESS